MHPRSRSTTSSRTLKFGLLALGAIAASSGALAMIPPEAPPTGGPQTIYRNLDEVEPRTIINSVNTPGVPGNSLYQITQPGSYYLTGNINVPAAHNGIVILTNGVTIDLMGFEIRPSEVGTLDGIRCNFIPAPGHRAVEIRNGSVRGMGENGINVGTTTARNVLIHDIRVSDNGMRGIIGGHGSVISNCVAHANGQQGIWGGVNGSVISCTSTSNLGDGFFLNTGCQIINCTAAENLGDGIEATTDCIIRDNSCVANGFGAASGAGILATNGNNRIEGNHCTRADRGVEVTGAGNFIVRNACANNGTDWVFAAGNCYATCVDRRSISGGAVNGFSSPSATFDAECCANVSY